MSVGNKECIGIIGKGSSHKEPYYYCPLLHATLYLLLQAPEALSCVFSEGKVGSKIDLELDVGVGVGVVVGIAISLHVMFININFFPLPN